MCVVHWKRATGEVLSQARTVTRTASTRGHGIELSQRFPHLAELDLMDCAHVSRRAVDLALQRCTLLERLDDAEEDGGEEEGGEQEGGEQEEGEQEKEEVEGLLVEEEEPGEEEIREDHGEDAYCVPCSDV